MQINYIYATEAEANNWIASESADWLHRFGSRGVDRFRTISQMKNRTTEMLRSQVNSSPGAPRRHTSLNWVDVQSTMAHSEERDYSAGACFM